MCTYMQSHKYSIYSKIQIVEKMNILNLLRNIKLRSFQLLADLWLSNLCIVSFFYLNFFLLILVKIFLILKYDIYIHILVIIQDSV